MKEQYKGIDDDVFGGPVRLEAHQVATQISKEPTVYHDITEYRQRRSNWEVWRKRLNAALYR